MLEAENRINAIAKDLVGHYIDNILPNGFKAQVVCHSKLACVRYQTGIKAALAERIAVFGAMVRGLDGGIVYSYARSRTLVASTQRPRTLVATSERP